MDRASEFRSIRLFCLLTTTLLISVFAQSGVAAETISDGKYEVEIQPEQDWIERIKLSELELSADSRRVDYLLVSRQIRMDEAGQRVGYYRSVSTPLSRAGLDDEATISIAYRPRFQKLVLHRMEAHRDGVVTNLLESADVRFVQEEADAKSRIYTEGLTLTITPEDLRVGDYIDVSYSIIGQNPLFEGVFYASNQTAWNTAVGTLQIRYLAPKALKLYTKSHNGSKSLQKSVSGDWQVYSLLSNENHSVDMETDYPLTRFPFPWVQISEFNSWKKLSKRLSSLFELQEPKSPSYRALVERLKSESSSKQEYLLKALDFVQEDITYVSLSVGVNSHKPRHPNTVLKSRFGDCKDKALLLVSLLESNGIKAQPALVSTTDRSSIAKDLPTPGAFDHAIVHAQIGKESYWYDATRTYQEGDIDHLVNADFGLALRLNSSGDKLRPTKLSKLQKNGVRVTEKIDFSDFSATPYVTIETRFSGTSAERFRSYLENTTRNEVSRYLRNYYADYYQGASIRSPYEYKDDKVRNQLTLLEHYSLPELSENHGASITAQFYHVGVWDKLQYPDHADRKTAYAPSSPVNVEYSIHVKYNEDSNFKIAPSSEKYTAFGLQYESASFGEAGNYQMHASLSMTADAIEPEDLAEYIKTMSAIKQDSSYSLTFSIPQTINAEKNMAALLQRLRQLSAPNDELALSVEAKK